MVIIYLRLLQPVFRLMSLNSTILKKGTLKLHLNYLNIQSIYSTYITDITSPSVQSNLT